MSAEIIVGGASLYLPGNDGCADGPAGADTEGSTENGWATSKEERAFGASSHRHLPSSTERGLRTLAKPPSACQAVRSDQ